MEKELNLDYLQKIGRVQEDLVKLQSTISSF
jgi:hypothetical protein